MKSKIIKHGVANGALILILGTAISKIIGALFKIPISSNAVLSDLGFGYFSAVYDVFTPVYLLALNGFPIAISKLVAEYIATNRYSDAKSVFRISKRTFLTFSVICFFVIVLLSFPISIFTDKTGKLIYGLLVAAPSVIICMVSAVYRGYFEGLHYMTPTAVSTIIEALGKLCMGLGFAYITVRLSKDYALSAAMAMFGITVGNLIAAIYLHITAKINKHLISDDEISMSPKSFSDKEIKRVLISITIPIVLAALSGSVMGLIDSLLVRFQLSSYSGKDFAFMEQMYASVMNEQALLIGKKINANSLPTVLYGVRSKAYTVFNLVPTITAAIGVSAIPVLTEAFSKKDYTSLKKALNLTFKLSSLFAFPAGFGIVALSERIMVLLYGNSASAYIGGKMLLIYGFAAAFAGVSITLGCVLQSLDLQKNALANVTAAIVIKIVLNIILCSFEQINIFGAVISTVICYAIMTFLHIYSIVKHIGKPDIISVALKPLIGAVCCGGIAFAISKFSESSASTVLAIFAGGVVYLIILSLFNTFDDEDILSFPMGDKLLKWLIKLKIVRNSS